MFGGSIFLCVIAVLMEGSSSLRLYNRERHSNIFKNILNANNYDKRVRPPSINDTGPVRVEVNMFVLDIPEVSAKNMDYTIQVYFRQSWLDPRLAFDDKPGDVGYLTLYDADKIWKPDTFFSNEKEAYFHHVLRPNLFVRIFPTGRVLYSVRLTLKLSCYMNLKKYPFDTQSCPFFIPTYRYTTDDIVFAYSRDNAISLNRDLVMKNYDVTGHLPGTCTSRTNTGDYSCLRVEFWFRRMSRSLDILVFIPCAMYVLLSWIPLWLDNTGAATRTRLAVPALLLVAMGSAVDKLQESEFPRASYTRAVDVWTTVTIAFVVAVWLDVALVELLARRGPAGPQKAQQTSQAVIKGTDGVEPLQLLDEIKEDTRNGPVRTTKPGNWQGTVRNWLKEPRSPADKLDLASRIVFPVAFFLFVVIYIRTYAVRLDVPEDEF